MNKIRLTLLFVFITLMGYSQGSSTAKDESGAFLETQIGLVSYSYFDVLAPSLEFKLATSVGKYFHMGGFVNGFSCIAQAEGVDVLGRTYNYSPKGLSAGMLLRVSTNSAKSHFYAELIGSAGKTFDTGIYSSGEETNAAEYLVGINWGGNFKSKDEDLWGIYAGISLGILDFDHSDKEGRIRRFRFGLTYHNKM